MGGNVFKEKTRRYNRDEYLTLELEVMGILSESIFTNYVNSINLLSHLRPIMAYATKPSFGDMDILVNSEYLLPNYIDIIVDAFKLDETEYHKNGNVLSIVYKQFQIDLIVTARRYFESSAEYFAFNDLGNLVGRLSKRIGIKYGHEGSIIVVKDGDHVLGEIFLTPKTSDLYKLLGLDFSVYQNGFDTLEDIFKFVSSSPYFNPDIYLLENRNSVSRVRDQKRKTYREFLEYCKNTPFDTVYNYADKSERGGYGIREPFFTKLIIPEFPHVLEKYNDIVKQHQRTSLFKEKFNGTVVGDLTGLQAVDLGNFMKYAKGRLNQDFVINSSTEEVNVVINQLFEDYSLTI